MKSLEIALVSRASIQRKMAEIFTITILAFILQDMNITKRSDIQTDTAPQIIILWFHFGHDTFSIHCIILTKWSATSGYVEEVQGRKASQDTTK